MAVYLHIIFIFNQQSSYLLKKKKKKKPSIKLWVAIYKAYYGNYNFLIFLKSYIVFIFNLL